MLRKSILSSLIAACALVALPVVAQAAQPLDAGNPNPYSTFAGVYPSTDACVAAGNAGVSEHRWDGFLCENPPNGGIQLWVAYKD